MFSLDLTTNESKRQTTSSADTGEDVGGSPDRKRAKSNESGDTTETDDVEDESNSNEKKNENAKGEQETSLNRKLEISKGLGKQIFKRIRNRLTLIYFL